MVTYNAVFVHFRLAPRPVYNGTPVTAPPNTSHQTLATRALDTTPICHFVFFVFFENVYLFLFLFLPLNPPVLMLAQSRLL